jgi:hypothetical protein
MLRRAAPTAAPANFTTPTVPRPAYRAPAGAPGCLPPAAPSPRSPWRAAQHIAAGAQQGAAAEQQGAAAGQQGAAAGQQGAAVGRQAAVAVQPWQAVCKGVLCYKGTGSKNVLEDRQLIPEQLPKLNLLLSQAVYARACSLWPASRGAELVHHLLHPPDLTLIDRLDTWCRC